MGITYRQGNDGRLTVQQMDDNFHYLEDQLAGLTSSNSDRLINNNLEAILDSKGTLNTPLLIPTSFTAVCDEAHMIEPVGFADDTWWQFEVAFQVNPDGSVETMINNIFPILTNPGYVSGYTFRFTEADHGIPDFIFDIELNDVTLPGGAGWTANLAVTQPPTYPSTIKSLGAIKLTSDTNSIILGTDGVLSIPNSIKFPFLPGNQRTGSGDNLQFEKGSVYQKIISTQDGTESAPTVERLVISGGDSYKNGLTYSGEGGDIYLWAGKGQDGGDIKVDAGEGISSGGTVKIRGGYTETGVGGFVQILAGESNNGYGGDLQITAGNGYGSGNEGIGGDVLITSGYGANTGGNIVINARDGGTAGNVIVQTAGNERMRITNDGKIGIGTTTPSVALDVNSDVNITGVITSTGSMILKPDSSLDTDQYIILDPTEGSPNHIHIRAGGAIDDSTADLFIGGEDNNLRVSDTDKTVQINSKNLYTQDSANFPSGANYDSATWSGNLITITNPIIGLINLINGYQAATDIFTVFYDPTTAVSLNITNKDISNYPTHVLTVDQTAPTASLAITQMLIEIVRYQSGRVIADNGTVTIQTGDTDGPESWVFGSPDGVGTLTFPDNSEQTTAYVPKYKVYTALLTQSGTASPTATILENTLGTEPIWIRNDVGIYSTNIAETTVVSFISGSTTNIRLVTSNTGSPNVIVESLNAYNNSSQDIDGFTTAVIEIRVYNIPA